MAEGDLIASTVVDGQPQFVCGPCQTACCLYPWPSLVDPLYPPEDLPDKLLVGLIDGDGNFIGDPVELTRSTITWDGSSAVTGLAWSDVSGYIYLSPPDESGNYPVAIVPTAVGASFDSVWLVCQITGVSDDEAVVTGIEGSQHCLVSMINDTDTFWRTDDEFSDNYTVNGSITITRQSHESTEALSCIWLGDGWRLKYNSSTFKWELNGVPKHDPQSSPVGNYSGNTIS